MLQQDLRRATSTALTQQVNTLRSAADTALGAVNAAERAATGLSDLDDDLDAVSELRDRALALLGPAPTPQRCLNVVS